MFALSVRSLDGNCHRIKVEADATLPKILAKWAPHCLPASSSRDAAAIHVAIKKDEWFRFHNGSKQESRVDSRNNSSSPQPSIVFKLANLQIVIVIIHLHTHYHCHCILSSITYIHTHSSPLVFQIFEGISTIRNTTTGKTTWHFCFSSSF